MPCPHHDFDRRLLTLSRWSRLLSILDQLALAVLQAELELALVHVSILVDMDAMSVAQVLQPLAVVLSLAGHLLPEAITTAFKPFSIVYVHIVSSVALGAQSTLSVLFIIKEESIVSLLPGPVEIVPSTMALTLKQTSLVKVARLVIDHNLGLFFAGILR